ncbi:MAG: hypothetical protein GY711_07530 [bacterium]|nr:hypothetical protein [bacterium]
MRKALLFLLVFGIGLGVLVWVDRTRSRESEPQSEPQSEPLERVAPESGEAPPPADAEQLTQNPGQPGGRTTNPSGRRQADLILDGQANILVFDPETGNKAYRVQGDFTAAGGPLERTYTVANVLLEVFDPISGVLRSTMRAREGRFGVDPARQLEDLRISDDGRIELFDVHVTQHVGGPLVPLDVRAPEMEVVLASELFRSVGDGEVDVTGLGLVGSGKGLELDGRAGKVVLERGGRVTFLVEEGSRATFVAPTGGRLEVESVGAAGENKVEANATGGAQLVLEGEPAGSVDAGRMRVFGSVVEGRGVRVESATAEENVTVLWDTDRFFGEDATVRVDAAGRLEHVIVREEPRASLTLVGDDGAEHPVELDGEGPLEIEADPLDPSIARFHFGGPGTLRAPDQDVTLNARGSLSGFADQTRSSASIEARGGAEFRQGEARVETEDMDALFASAGEQIDVTCSGETQVFGREETRGLFTLGAREEVLIEVQGERWSVPSARQATLFGVSDERVRLTAGLIRDYDGESSSFHAEEGVTYASPTVEGEAERAVSTGDGSISFFGTREKPARVRLVDESEDGARTASFEALEIDADPTAVEARGTVRGALRAGDVELELGAGFTRFSKVPGDADSAAAFLIDAREVGLLELLQDGERSRVSCDELLVRGTLPKEGQAGEPEATTVLAQGAVRLRHEGTYTVDAEGGRLEMTVGGRTRLEGEASESDDRVSARGPVPGRELQYLLEADWIEYEELRLEAAAPSLTLTGSLFSAPGPQPAPESGEQAPGADAGSTTVDAEALRISAIGVHFDGKVRMRSTTEEGLPVVLEADTLLLGGTLTEEGMANLGDSVRSLEARGRVLFLWGGLGFARATRLRATRERVVLEGAPAVVDVGGHTLESGFIDVDLVHFLIASERGVLRAPELAGGWSVEFAAVRPVQTPVGTMIALSNPIYQAGKDEARAQFAALWIHEDAWRERGHAALWDPAPDPAAPPAAREPKPDEPKGDLVHNVFIRIGHGVLPEFARNLWLEGDVEATENGNRVARADEVYLDLEARHGRLANAELSHVLELGSRSQLVRTKAGEILTSSDGSMIAEKATLTACDHDVPHYVIEVGKLLLVPREDGRWRFGAQDNRIAFRGGVELPLPSLGNVVLDDQGDFVGFENNEGEVRTIDQIALRDTARFGTTLGASFKSEIGAFGRRVADIFGFHKEYVQGEWQLDGAWLSDRGPLLGVGLSLTERARTGSATGESFWLDLYTTGIPDGGEDRGLLRVPEDERDDFRHWTYGRGRYPFSKKTWIDLAFSTQSDAGVQSEFYQREFQTYEQRENFIQFRTARDGTLVEAAIEPRVDDYRTEVEELPAAGFYRGSSQVATLGPLSLDYSMALDAERLRRREGDRRFEQVYRDSAGNPDGLGEREVFRVDNRHRLEVPMSTDVAGLRATPHLEAQLTAWDEGVDPEDNPRRLGLIGGVEVATTLHKRGAGGFLHSMTPFAGWRTDIALDESNGVPVRFDSVDDPLDGNEVQVGVRTLWERAVARDSLDLELRATRRTERAEDLKDLEEVSVLGELKTSLFSRPFVVRHDGRYDTTDGDTLYSRSSMAIAPSARLEFELGFRRGLSVEERTLFEAASLDTLFRLDEKWEIELGQQISISGSDTLKSQGILRRFSHDFVLELSVAHRAGEGTTFGITFRPLLAYSSSGLGGLSEND